MVRRLFWVSVGVGVTVYVLTKVNKANAIINRFTPEGVSASVTNLAQTLRQASSDLKEAMAENEQAITEALTAPSDSARDPQSRSIDPWWDTEAFLDEENPPEM